ncbi:unnamed protein product, partial [Prorocentrum cordatum]
GGGAEGAWRAEVMLLEARLDAQLNELRAQVAEVRAATRALQEPPRPAATPPGTAQGTPSSDDAALARLEEAVREHREELRGLREQQAGATPSAQDLAALEGRLRSETTAALEAVLARHADDLAMAPTMSRKPSVNPGLGLPADVADLSGRVAGLGEKMEERCAKEERLEKQLLELRRSVQDLSAITPTTGHSGGASTATVAELGGRVEAMREAFAERHLAERALGQQVSEMRRRSEELEGKVAALALEREGHSSGQSAVERLQQDLDGRFLTLKCERQELESRLSAMQREQQDWGSRLSALQRELQSERAAASEREPQQAQALKGLQERLAAQVAALDERLAAELRGLQARDGSRDEEARERGAALERRISSSEDRLDEAEAGRRSQEARLAQALGRAAEEEARERAAALARHREEAEECVLAATGRLEQGLREEGQRLAALEAATAELPGLRGAVAGLERGAGDCAESVAREQTQRAADTQELRHLIEAITAAELRERVERLEAARLETVKAFEAAAVAATAPSSPAARSSSGAAAAEEVAELRRAVCELREDWQRQAQGLREEQKERFLQVAGICGVVEGVGAAAAATLARAERKMASAAPQADSPAKLCEELPSQANSRLISELKEQLQSDASLAIATLKKEIKQAKADLSERVWKLERVRDRPAAIEPDDGSSADGELQSRFECLESETKRTNDLLMAFLRSTDQQQSEAMATTIPGTHAITPARLQAAPTQRAAAPEPIVGEASGLAKGAFSGAARATAASTTAAAAAVAPQATTVTSLRSANAVPAPACQVTSTRIANTAPPVRAQGGVAPAPAAVSQAGSALAPVTSAARLVRASSASQVTARSIQGAPEPTAAALRATARPTAAAPRAIGPSAKAHAGAPAEAPLDPAQTSTPQRGLPWPAAATAPGQDGQARGAPPAAKPAGCAPITDRRPSLQQQPRSHVARSAAAAQPPMATATAATCAGAVPLQQVGPHPAQRSAAAAELPAATAAAAFAGAAPLQQRAAR